MASCGSRSCNFFLLAILDKRDLVHRYIRGGLFDSSLTRSSVGPLCVFSLKNIEIALFKRIMQHIFRTVAAYSLKGDLNTEDTVTVGVAGVDMQHAKLA